MSLAEQQAHVDGVPRREEGAVLLLVLAVLSAFFYKDFSIFIFASDYHLSIFDFRFLQLFIRRVLNSQRCYFLSIFDEIDEI